MFHSLFFSPSIPFKSNLPLLFSFNSFCLPRECFSLISKALGSCALFGSSLRRGCEVHENRLVDRSLRAGHNLHIWGQTTPPNVRTIHFWCLIPFCLAALLFMQTANQAYNGTKRKPTKFVRAAGHNRSSFQMLLLCLRRDVSHRGGVQLAPERS